jgi:hypothetical protein
MSRDALVVGINQYKTLPNLGAAAADAQATAHLLQTQGEFRVARLPEIIEAGNKLSVGSQTPVTASSLEQALVQLFKPSGNTTTSLALFYFSGHGIQRDVGIREGYLATSDTNHEHGNFGISLSWLRRLIEESPIKQIVVILDCCHSGELFNFQEAKPRNQEGNSYLFMAASRAYEAAYETLDGEHSVLTKAVLSGLDPHRVEQGQITNHSLLNWVSNELKEEVQQPLFECAGSEIILTRASGYQLPPVKSRISTLAHIRQLTYGFCPYRGLEPFSEKHADYFFGRDELVEALLERLRTSNFCAVVGASSSGKTSLLRAGLIHQLRQGKRIPDSDHWLLKLITPGQQPLRNLATLFTDPEAGDIQLAAQLHQAETLLAETDQGLAQLVAATLMPGAHDSGAQFWLIIDQFEELLKPTANAQVMTERHQFVQCLLTALQAPDLAFGVVLSVRADAMDGLLAYPDLLQLLEKNQLMMTPIPYRQLKSVITQPAEKMGLQLDPLLLHQLMLDLTGAPGELALLQQTMLELWRRRESSSFLNGTPRLTLSAYLSLGGIKNVLISRAEAIYEELSQPEKAAAERIFLALCELGEGCEDNKRRAYKRELINADFPEALISQTLEKLVTARLVIVGQDATSDSPNGSGLSVPGVAWKTQLDEVSEVKRWFVQNESMAIAGAPETIELAHKSLIYDWLRLRQWIIDRRPIIREQHRLEVAAQEWHQRRRPKHPEYLLGGRLLKDVDVFLKHHSHTLSSLALEFVEASRRAQRRQWIKSSTLGLLVPLAMIAGMAVSFARARLPGLWNTTQPTIVKEMIGWAQPNISLLSSPVQNPAALRPGVVRFERQRVIPRTPRTSNPTAPVAVLQSDPAYVMESVGQMTDPEDATRTIEIWVVRPRDVEFSQVPDPSNPQPE